MAEIRTKQRVRISRRCGRRKHSILRYVGSFVGGVLVILAVAAWVFVLREGGGPPISKIPDLPSPAQPATTKGSGAELIHLPADDASHHNATEWWYYNGHLHTRAGRRYAYHVAVFLLRGLTDHTLFNVSLVDLQTGKYYTDQARTGGIPSSGKQDGFNFSYAGWQVAGSGPKHKLNIKTKDFTLVLDLTDASPPTLHQAPGSGGPGLLDFGAAGKSYYYSRTRMPSHGTLSLAGVSMPVEGQSWFDHQWGDFDSTALTWNWFAIQLDDGADIMLYQVFDPQGKVIMQAGTYSRNGHTTMLGKGDYVLKSSGIWTSPVSRVTYPVAWDISIPSQKLALSAKPFVNACEFNGLETIMKTYWEGPVKIAGSKQGVGYLELSGYGKELKK